MNLFLCLVSEQAGTSSWQVVKEAGAGKTDRQKGVDRDPSLSLPRWTGDSAVAHLQLGTNQEESERIRFWTGEGRGRSHLHEGKAGLVSFAWVPRMRLYVIGRFPR